MTKVTRPTVLVLLALVLSAPTVSRADSITKAKKKDIPMLLDAATGMNSAYSALLIGETLDRVYFEYITGIHASSIFTNRPKRIVYWLPRTDVTDEQMAQFRAYRERQMKAYKDRPIPGK